MSDTRPSRQCTKCEQRPATHEIEIRALGVLRLCGACWQAIHRDEQNGFAEALHSGRVVVRDITPLPHV